MKSDPRRVTLQSLKLHRECTPTVRTMSTLERNTCRNKETPIGSPADNSDESRAVARKAEGARNKGHRQAGSDQAAPTADAKQRTARAAHVERGQASKDWEHHKTPDVGDKENPRHPYQGETTMRQQDEIWDALDQHFGPVRTKSERGRRCVAVKELREAGATPDEIRIAYQFCQQSFSVFTEIALAQHFGRAQHLATRPAVVPLTLVRKMADGQ